LDILKLENKEDEEDLKKRKSVAIQADVRKIDWKLLVRIQIIKYKCLFDTIIMDPLWDLKEYLKYSVLKLEDVFKIPYSLLQFRGYVMI
jgi:hypothetical protein